MLIDTPDELVTERKSGYGGGEIFRSLKCNKAGIEELWPCHWPISEAMDYIAAQLGNENEQDIGKKYRKPAELLTTKARLGEIKIWGKRIIGKGAPEIARIEIPASAWSDIQLNIWASLPHTIEPQTEPVTQSFAQQLTDLHVNATQIKAIKWQQENI